MIFGFAVEFDRLLFQLLMIGILECCTKRIDQLLPR